MFHRIIRNDLRKSRLSSLATLLFVAAAALLVSLAGTMAVELSGAVAALMEAAATPHLLQMHSGPIDLPRLEAFAAARPEVERFQVLEFLNVDGADFELGGKSLSGSVQDNGLSVQGRDFDFLLDLAGKPITARPGELHVPLCYLKDGSARLGDRARVLGREFRVAGWVRDSQMNSALSSSKRFIVHETDYAALRGLGSVEYLVEFRLRDRERLGDLETAYVAAGLEANGPRVGYPLFKLMNAVSDGLMIAVLFLVGGLVTAVALLCIRLTLLAKIEEEVEEFKQAAGGEGRERMEEEFGDLLLALVNLARHLGIHAEGALQVANERFSRRFRILEAELHARGSDPSREDPETLDRMWREAKRRDGAGG